MCMQFTLDKIPSKVILFITQLLLLVIPFRKATNSAGPGARQSTTDSAQLVDQIRTLYESKPLAFKPCICTTVRELMLTFPFYPKDDTILVVHNYR